MSDNGRKADGTFAKGNTLQRNGGRPSKKREDRYYEIAIGTCSFKDWKAIIARAVTQAIDGDKDARKWLADYLMGPPRVIQTSDPDAPTIDEWWERADRRMDGHYEEVYER